MSQAADSQKTRLTGYQKKLFVFLGVASFFEGYDFIALTQLLPNIRADFGTYLELGDGLAMNLPMAKADGGLMIALINLGTIVAYFLVRRADLWGRRRVLTLTIAGYTIATFLSGLSPDPVSFTVFQFFGRVFLIAEWAVAMVYAAEEFPAEHRGLIIGLLQGFSSFGAIVCAGVVPLLLTTQLGWRTVYLVGVAPLVLVAVARRSLRETRRFEEQAKLDSVRRRRPLTHIFRTPYRKRLLQLSLIWALTYMCNNTAIAFWKDFAVNERGLSDGQVGASITVAALVSMPLILYSGRLLDRFGRRPGAVIIFTLSAAGAFFSYQLEGQWPLTAALVFGVFGASATLPVLNAYTTELFPTDLRGDAFAWSNNLLGRIGYASAPLIVGQIAQDTGWGPAVASMAIFPLIAVGLVLWLMPETGGRELEETARIEESNEAG